jgi:hypothetical protein
MSLGLGRNHEKMVGRASVPAMTFAWCAVRTLQNFLCTGWKACATDLKNLAKPRQVR